MFMVMPGQIVAQWVKKKFATMILGTVSPVSGSTLTISCNETSFPSWLVNLKSGISCQMISFSILPLTTFEIVESS